MCADFAQHHQVRAASYVLNCALFLNCAPSILLDDPTWKRKWSEKEKVLSIEIVDPSDYKFLEGN